MSLKFVFLGPNLDEHHTPSNQARAVKQLRKRNKIKPRAHGIKTEGAESIYLLQNTLSDINSRQRGDIAKNRKQRMCFPSPLNKVTSYQRDMNLPNEYWTTHRRLPTKYTKLYEICTFTMRKYSTLKTGHNGRCSVSILLYCASLPHYRAKLYEARTVEEKAVVTT